MIKLAIRMLRKTGRRSECDTSTSLCSVSGETATLLLIKYRDYERSVAIPPERDHEKTNAGINITFSP